jgi:hypothetical protein
MTLDHISATKTYVMWREENLWNVNVFQRVHISNLVFIVHIVSTGILMTGICCNVKRLYSGNNVSKGVQYTGNAESA